MHQPFAHGLFLKLQHSTADLLELKVCQQIWIRMPCTVASHCMWIQGCLGFFVNVFIVVFNLFTAQNEMSYIE